MEKTIKLEEGVLGFADLWAIGIGQVIGAGVITLIGPAIAATGVSAWLAYLVAILLGLLTNLPIIMFTSTTKFSGGNYSIITLLGGEKVGGMYIVGFSLMMLLMSLFITALGIYIHSIFPFTNGTLIGVGLFTLFYLINLLGMANMARFQKIMTVILIVALLMFILIGATKSDFSQAINFTDKGFFANGSSGFWKAVFMLLFSCQGYVLVTNYGGQAKQPKKNLPKAMFAVIPVIIILYCGISLVDVSVLPLSQVSGKPLTLAAKTILPKPLFYLFIFGGPIMALLTTINSMYATMVGPFTRAAKDGWLPSWLAKKNKFGGATIILTIELLVGLIPVILGFSIGQIVRNIMILISFYNFLLYYALFNVPKKMPEKWERATLHTSNGVYYSIIIAASLVQLIIFYNSVKNISLGNAIFVISLMIICFIYAIIRHNQGKTNIDTEGMLELD